MAICLMVSSFGVAKAQSGLQVGANLGPTMGVSVKYEFAANQAIEGIAGYNIPHDGPSFKFMYEYQVALVDALKLYMGGGINIGGLHMNHHHGDFAFGLVPTIGLDYAFRGVPVNFAFGYEPAINFGTTKTWTDVAFKVRYRF